MVRAAEKLYKLMGLTTLLYHRAEMLRTAEDLYKL